MYTKEKQGLLNIYIEGLKPALRHAFVGDVESVRSVLNDFDEFQWKNSFQTPHPSPLPQGARERTTLDAEQTSLVIASPIRAWQSSRLLTIQQFNHPITSSLLNKEAAW